MIPTERVAIVCPEPAVIRRHDIYSDEEGTLYARVGESLLPLNMLNHFVREESAVPKMAAEFQTNLYF